MKYILNISIFLLAAVGLAYFYAFRLDPVMRTHADAVELRAQLARNERQPKVVFVGGSSCAHSVRPDVLAAEGLCAVNMGYHAGAGAPFLIAAGMSVAKPGDLLIVAIEPELLMEDSSVSRVGLVGAIKLGKPSLASGTPFSDQDFSYGNLFFSIRPGGTRLLKHFGAMLIRFDLEQFSTIDSFGRMNDTRQVAFPAEIPAEYIGITEQNKSILQSVVAFGKESGVDIICAVPWKLHSAEDRRDAEKWYNQYVNEISEIMPVLVEDELNVRTDEKLFSDTFYHLTTKGASKRSLAYARALHLGKAVSAYGEVSIDCRPYLIKE